MGNLSGSSAFPLCSYASGQHPTECHQQPAASFPASLTGLLVGSFPANFTGIPASGCSLPSQVCGISVNLCTIQWIQPQQLQWDVSLSLAWRSSLGELKESSELFPLGNSPFHLPLVAALYTGLSCILLNSLKCSQQLISVTS